MAVHGCKPPAPRQTQMRFSPRRFPFQVLELGTHKEQVFPKPEDSKRFKCGPAGLPHSHEQLLPPPVRGPGGYPSSIQATIEVRNAEHKVVSASSPRGSPTEAQTCTLGQRGSRPVLCPEASGE